MDSTHEFVEKLHEKQKKAEQNKKRQGKQQFSILYTQVDKHMLLGI